MEPTDNAALGAVSELPGRNESPIKGESRDIFPRPQGGRGYFRASSPSALCATVPAMLIVVGPLAPAARQRIPIPSGVMLVIVTGPFVFL